MKWPLQKIVIHLVCCVAFLMLPIIVSPGFSIAGHWGSGAPEIRNFISSILMIIFFYLNYYYFIPAFYHEKKYVIFSIITLICFALCIIIPSILYPEYNDARREMPLNAFAPTSAPPPEHSGMQHHGPFELFQLESAILKFLIIFALSMLIKIRELWQISQEEKRIAELSYLRLQVNPHFLFNTLNSIYSLALEKSDKTPAAIVKLSELMRYVTSEVNREFVSLDKEVNYLSNYIELQRIRLDETVEINYSVSGNRNEDRIAPLLLIPFIENAFKFGVNPESNAQITVSLNIEGHLLKLLVINKKIAGNKDLVQSGTGLGNVQKRLKLIYPTNHHLAFHENNQEFIVKLTLQLI